MNTRSVLTAMDIAMAAAGLAGLGAFAGIVFASFLK